MTRRVFSYPTLTLLATSLLACEDTTAPTAAARPATAQLEEVSAVDTTPPVITYTVIDGTLGLNGWYTSETVTITFTITDPESPAAPSSTTTCGTRTIYDLGIRASDGPLCTATSAGGVSSLALDIFIDAWPPDLTGPFGISPAASASGWWNTDVSISYTCDDGAGSGELDSHPTVTVSTEGVNQPYTLSCTDRAGNRQAFEYAFFPLVAADRSVTQVYISIDKTPPTVAPTVSPNPVLLGGSATVSPNATDPLSGVASQSCGAVVTSSVGPKSVTCTATDRAANTSTASVAYKVVYPFAGFTGLNLPPALNSVRAGTSALLTFSLGGNRGLGILAAGSPTSQAISCTTLAAVSTLQTTAAGSTLTYSAKTNNYTYTWKTDPTWAGTCRRLSLKLIDGTERVVYFQLRK